jgi:hypothetical protein
MARLQSTAAVSLVLAIGVTIVAVGLALHLRYQRRRRETGLSDADAHHFARQDIRRAVVAVVMVLLALGVAVGARIEPKIAGRVNPWFIAIWLAIIALVFVLLWLALLDWIATWLYARRHRRDIVREHRELLRDEVRRHTYRGDGQGTPQDPSDGPSVP